MQGEFCKFRKNFQLQICLAVTCVLCALKKMRQATCLLTFRVVPHVLVQSIALPCLFKKTATHQTCVATFVSALQYRPELQQVAKVQSKAKTNCNNFFAVRVLPCLRKALPCRAFSKKPQHIRHACTFLIRLCSTDLNFNKWQKCSQKRKQIATTFSPLELICLQTMI